MSARGTEPLGHPPLTDAMIASYLRGRGDAPAPDGLLAAARAQVLQPVRSTWPRLALGLAVTLSAVLVAVVVLTLPRRQTPPMPISGQVAPARELVLAIYRSSNSGNDVWLEPADPETALPIEGVKPIHVYEPLETDLSPDGRTLAVTTIPASEMRDGQAYLLPESGTIRLIDLDSWSVKETPVTQPGRVWNLTWTPDSQALVWLTPTRTEADLGGRAWRVMRWSVGSQAPEVVLDLPDPAFVPDDARMMSGGPGTGPSTFIVYGRVSDGSDDASVMPHVLAIDLETPRVLEEVELPVPRLGAAGERPLVLWDLPRDRLLVATLDSLVTVGLPGMGIEVRPIDSAGATAGPRDPPTVTATGAATLMPRTVLSGALDADGDRLYLTGLGQSLGDEGARYVPIGLRVIDTRDGSMVATGDASIGQLTLSPSGDRMLVASYPADGASSYDYEGAVRMLEPDTLDVLARVAVADGAASPGPVVMSTSWDGRFGYLGTYVRDGDNGHSQVDVIDLADGRTIAANAMKAEDPLLAVLALGGNCGGIAGC